MDYSQLLSLEKKPKVASPDGQNTFASLLANQQVSKEANQQVSKEANQQVSKPTKQHTNKSANQFAGKEANQQTTKLANQQTTKEKKKYGTYLREESISAIQMLAIQTKRKDHEVLQEIIDVYFAGGK